MAAFEGRVLALLEDRRQGEFLEREVGLEPMAPPHVRLLVVTREDGPTKFLDREVTLDAGSDLEDPALETDTESFESNWVGTSDGSVPFEVLDKERHCVTDTLPEGSAGLKRRDQRHVLVGAVDFRPFSVALRRA